MVDFRTVEVWVIICTAIAFFMQAGFLCFETGLSRSKNSIDVACKNLFDFCVAGLVFWCFGFGFMFGDTVGGLIGGPIFTYVDVNAVAQTPREVATGLPPGLGEPTARASSPPTPPPARSYIFEDNSAQHWPTIFFLFQLVYCGTSITIVSGAVGERMRFIPYVLIAVLVGLVIYPIFGHWAWAGLGTDGPEGNPPLVGLLGRLGFIDFAGSTVLHSLGAWVALACVIILKPRLGKFPESGPPRKLQGHNLPLAALGLFIMWFGWFGVTGGRTFAPDSNVPVILVNTLLAGVSGGIGGLLSSLLAQNPGLSRRIHAVAAHFSRRDDHVQQCARPQRLAQAKFSLQSIMNGVVAGLVAVSAGCNLVSHPWAVFIGLSAALIMQVGAWSLENVFYIDDEVGAISSHGAAGVWGTLIVPWIVSSSYIPNNFAGSAIPRLSLFGIQLLGVAACFLWAFVLTFAFLRILQRLEPLVPSVKLRPDPDEEERGMNIVEHGASTEYEVIVGHMEAFVRGEPVAELAIHEFTDMRVLADLWSKVRAAQEALDANREKTEFLRSMSHELRTPMQAILGYADLLSDRLQRQEDREGAESAQTILRQGEYLLQLINEILDLSRIEAGKMSVQHQAFALNRLVREVVELMSVQSKPKGLALTSRHVGEIPEFVVSDKTRIRQILINLLSNAIKFTEAPGSIQLVTRMTKDDPPMLQFDVVDSGIGMDEGQLSRLFRPFTQFDSSTGGTGLGLTISKRLAKLLGGDIDVRSVKGHGSTFSVVIPCDTETDTNETRDDGDSLPPVETALRLQNEDSDVGGADTSASGARILLVEDTVDSRRLVRYWLERSGARVEVAENGLDGLETALAAWAVGEPFDLVLMDMRMPVMNGYEATRGLRAAAYPGTVVALTAHAMPDEREKCLDAGCDEFVTKPLTKDTIGKLVRETRTRRPSPSDRPDKLYSAEQDEQFKELIVRFVDQVPDYVGNLRDLVARRDWDQIEGEVHKLKGLVGMYGFHHATPFSLAVLNAVRGRRPDAEIVTACERLIDVLERLSFENA